MELSDYVGILEPIATDMNELANANRENVDGAGREFALAVTHIEDAIMRINRAYAKKGGFFKVGNTQVLGQTD